MPWNLDGQAPDNSLSERDVQTTRLKNVHYVQGGNSDGMPVLMLHDNLASSRWWEAIQEMLPYRYGSIALDLRGFGGTDYAPVKSLADFADDLHDFVLTLGLRPFMLVGWGMGGGIAMQYALQHPDHLTALCLVNSISPKGHRSRGREEVRDELTRALRNHDKTEIATYLRHNYFYNGNFPIGQVANRGEDGTGPNANPAVFDYILTGATQGQGYESPEHEELFEALQHFDVHQEVGQVAMPVFMITSQNDSEIREEERRELREAIANDQYTRDEVELSFCGHSPMVEMPDQFSQALNGYAGRLNFQHVVNPSTVESAARMRAKDDQSGQRFGTNPTSSIAYEKPEP